MGPLVAAGAVRVAEQHLRSLELSLDNLCNETGFPVGEEFKWSPGRDLWMHGNLHAEARQLFFKKVLEIAHVHQSTITVVIEDTNHSAATGARTPELDVTRMLLERINADTGAIEPAMVVADRPSGGRADEDKFIASCVETLRTGTNVVRKLDRIALILASNSRLLRGLQLADLITSCVLALVSGEERWSSATFEHIKPLLRSEFGRIGGVGVKIHPDFNYVNLYHWLLGDTHYIRFYNGWPMPLKGRPYANSPLVF